MAAHAVDRVRSFFLPLQGAAPELESLAQRCGGVSDPAPGVGRFLALILSFFGYSRI